MAGIGWGGVTRDGDGVRMGIESCSHAALWLRHADMKSGVGSFSYNAKLVYKRNSRSQCA